MRAASDETERRRDRQVDYNRVHGITPRGIEKAVMDIMEGAREAGPTARPRFGRVAETGTEYGAVSASEVTARIGNLEKRMFEHAESLEFEEAAALRDEIERIRAQGRGFEPGRRAS